MIARLMAWCVPDAAMRAPFVYRCGVLVYRRGWSLPARARQDGSFPVGWP